MANNIVSIEVKVTWFGKYILPFHNFIIAQKIILLMGKKIPIAKMYTSNKIEKIYLKEIFKANNS